MQVNERESIHSYTHIEIENCKQKAVKYTHIHLGGQREKNEQRFWFGIRTRHIITGEAIWEL